MRSGEPTMRLRQAKKRVNRAAARRSVAFAVRLVVLILATTGVTLAQEANDKTRGRAERALRQGEYVMAETLFRGLLASDAVDKNAHLGLSFCLLKQRNLREAFDHAAQAVAIDPDS